jgi:hypothetical protein
MVLEGTGARFSTYWEKAVLFSSWERSSFWAIGLWETDAFAFGPFSSFLAISLWETDALAFKPFSCFWAIGLWETDAFAFGPFEGANKETDRATPMARNKAARAKVYRRIKPPIH